MLKFSSKFNADRLGMLLSAICAIHCLAFPLLALSSSYVAKLLGSDYIHLFLLILLIPISFIAFIKQKRKHQKATPSILGTIGLGILASALVTHDQVLGPYTEEILSTLGSAILITAHALNLKHLKNCSRCSHH